MNRILAIKGLIAAIIISAFGVLFFMRDRLPFIKLRKEADAE